MLRSAQEKEQLVRKFEEIAPFLKSQDNFGWVINECYNNPHYKILPAYDNLAWTFRPFVMNIKTGWHSEYIYRDGKDLVRVPEGVVELDDDWRDNCYRQCCSKPAYITSKEDK